VAISDAAVAAAISVIEAADLESSSSSAPMPAFGGGYAKSISAGMASSSYSKPPLMPGANTGRLIQSLVPPEQLTAMARKLSRPSKATEDRFFKKARALVPSRENIQRDPASVSALLREMDPTFDSHPPALQREIERGLSLALLGAMGESTHAPMGDAALSQSTISPTPSSKGEASDAAGSLPSEGGELRVQSESDGIAVRAIASGFVPSGFVRGRTDLDVQAERTMAFAARVPDADNKKWEIPVSWLQSYQYAELKVWVATHLQRFPDAFLDATVAELLRQGLPDEELTAGTAYRMVARYLRPATNAFVDPGSPEHQDIAVAMNWTQEDTPVDIANKIVYRVAARRNACFPVGSMPSTDQASARAHLASATSSTHHRQAGT